MFSKRTTSGALLLIFCASLLSPKANAVTYGSTVADPTISAPWAVSIWNSPNNDEANAEFICSGTLISPHTVLTAAHCTLEPGAYFVKVKSQALNDQTPFTTVSGVWTNPRYDAKTFVNDIGLLKLDDDFPGITYPSLANAQAAKSINAKTTFQLYGWGIDQAGQDADLLKSAKLGLQDNQAAKDFKSSFNSKTMISAGRKITAENVWSGACNGDSGGPLATKINGITVIAGVTSWGEKGCKSPKPTVFSRVSYYFSDIQNGLKSVELKSSVVNRTAPVATTDPQITGTFSTNGSLTCDPGQWKNSVSTSVAWTSPKRLLGTTSSTIRVATADAGQTFSCTVIISTKSGTIVRKVLTKQSPSAPVLTAQPAISGVDLSAPATAGSTLRCDSWNWDGPVDTESIQWFLTSQVNPSAPVNGQLVGSGRTLALDANLIGQLKGRFVTCDITGVRNGFSVDGITSIKLNPQDGPAVTSVNVSGSSLSLGSSLTCLFTASQSATQVEILWGTSPDGISFYAFPGITGNVLQINKSVMQQGAGKIVACQVKVTNSVGQAKRIGVANSPFPNPPVAPIVSISNSGAISANSYLSCSAQAGAGYYGQLTYQWGVTSAPNSDSFIGATLGTSYSLSMNTNYLTQAAGNYLTCVATATNEAGSTSGASSIFVPNSVLPLPIPATPVVQSEKVDATSATEIISVPYFAGFDSTKMSLILNLTGPTGSCSASNSVNSVPSTISCTGLALSTRYTASLTLSYNGNTSFGSSYSQQLIFTTGKSSIPTTPPSVFNYSSSYTGYAAILPASATAASLATTGLDIRFVAQDSAVPVTSAKAQLLASNGQVIASGAAIFQGGNNQDGAWKVSLSIPSTTPAGSYSVQAAASDGYNTSAWVGLGNLTITAPVSVPLPTPGQPQIVSETAQNGSVAEIISVPAFSGFNPSTMQLALNIQSSGGGCNNPVTSIPSNITCVLAPNTPYTAYVVVSYQSGQGSGTQSSSALSFTTGSAAPANTIRVVVDPIDSSGITNIGYCFTSPGSLTGTVNTSATISGPGYSGTQLAGTGAFLSYAGMPSCPTKIGVSTGYRLTPSSTYTFTITATNNGQTYTNSSTWTTQAAPLLGALTPNLSSPSNVTTSGFAIQVTNYDPNFTWAVSTSAGAVTINNTGLIIVTGLASQQSTTVTVNTSQIGYANGSNSKIGTSLVAVIIPAPTMTTSSQSYGAQTPGRNFSFTVGITGAISVTASATNGTTTLSAPFVQGPSGDNWIYVTSGGSGGVTGYTGSIAIPTSATPGTYSLTYAATNSAGVSTLFSGGNFSIPTPIDPNAPAMLSSQLTSANTSFNYGADSNGTQILLQADFANASSVSLSAVLGSTSIIAGFNPGPSGYSYVYRWSAYFAADTTFRAALLFMAAQPKGTYTLTWAVTNQAGTSATFSAGIYNL